jgi:Zn-dependent protease
VHADALRALAAEARTATTAGRLPEARGRWEEVLARLPADAPQRATVLERIVEIDRRIAEERPGPRPASDTPAAPWWRRGAAAAGGLGLLLLGKLKLLLLGLTKASTLLSMFAFFGLYWSVFGWPLALGFVLSIYVHEMGHVLMLRRLGIDAGAPVFIPGVGAFVRLRQRVDDPRADAAVGLAGPVWGLGAGMVAYAAGLATGAPIWMAIAHLGGYLNLFNLIPVWQLDGARGFHALTRVERWLVVAALAVAWLLTHEGLLLIIGAVAAWRALERAAGPGDRRALGTFLVLIAALSWLCTLRAV